ncbi:hypothetical protein L1987_78745 [Smallanthus sonchifolius]|uniref:Uncharacterized protein n=1 Tax=Smallanthus sonchifolius TaxID=185202 RepID=A0ACB8ZEL2_9ASTR|nr:hypothetical protein L1987_78745 [Smallanthus sonchifolius]
MLNVLLWISIRTIGAEKRAGIAEEKGEDIKKIVVAKSQLMEKDRQEISDLKKELEVSKLLHLKEIDVTVEETKKSAALSILQSRIKMAEEASAEGFDMKTLDLEGWRRISAGLMGEKMETSKVGDEAGDGVEKEVPQGDEGKDA